MSVVYVREQGAVIRKTGELLRVMLGELETFRVPLANVEQLVLMGNAQLTTPAAVTLLQTGVDVVFMSKYGKYRGRLVSMGSKFAKLRHAQLRLCDDASRSLDIARQVVRGKIVNQRVILQRRTQDDPRGGNALTRMSDMLKLAEQVADIDALRGCEGQAAASYFDSLRPMFSPDWGFTARAYHPPPDPANALLSFVYTLLLKDVEAKIQLVGLDPYLGFLHALGYNRPALALDLMEEFRPSIADSVVFTMVRERQILPQDFERTANEDLPVRMSANAVQRVVEAYEARLQDKVFHPVVNGQTDYRHAIELQVRQMARIVRGEQSSYAALTMS